MCARLKLQVLMGTGSGVRVTFLKTIMTFIKLILTLSYSKIIHAAGYRKPNADSVATRAECVQFF